MSIGSFKVKIFDAKGTQVVPLQKSTLTVGSASHCDIVLKHTSIQPEHIRAWIDGGRIWIQDLGTTTGTTLNGIRLPVLKPMLVREMDVVKLGDCPATLGLEANLVRAPVFRQAPPVEEVTATDIRAIDTKDVDSAQKIEALTRELADLKLKIQKSNESGDSSDELKKQLNRLQQELLSAKDQNKRLSEAAVRIDQEKQSERERLENEIAELKLKGLRDLKDQRDHQRVQFNAWKDQALIEINRQTRQLSRTKTKAWLNRPLTQDQVLEWESDIDLILRRVLLDEQSGQPEVSMPSIEMPALAPPPPPPPAVEVPEVTSPSLAVSQTNYSVRTSRSRVSQKQSAAADSLVRYILWGLGSVCVGGLVYFNLPFLNELSHFRSVASTSSSVIENSKASSPKPQLAANSAPPKPHVQAPAPTPAPAPVPMPEEPYQTQKVPGFKKTYSENMVFTEGFEASEINMEFRRKWVAELQKKAKTWKVSEDDLNWVADKELKFILDLRRMKAGIVSRQAEKSVLDKMLKRESVFLKEIEGRLKGKQTVDKFLKFKAGFYVRNGR